MKTKNYSLHDISEQNLSIIVNNISNYNDLVRLKKTDKYLKDFITSEIPTLQKNAEIYPHNPTIRMSMNVMDMHYKALHIPLFGAFLEGTIFRTAPSELYSLVEYDYVEFSFLAPALLSSRSRKKIKLTVRFKLSLNTVYITYDENITPISYTVPPSKIRNYIHKLLKLYHKSKEQGNLLFIVLNANNSLDIIVTDSKLEKPSCLKIS
jgi:hypothetical protein